MPVWRPRAGGCTRRSAAPSPRGVDLELVVVDDGNDSRSPTCSPAVDDPRLVHVRVEHGGVSAARNAGTARRGRAVPPLRRRRRRAASRAARARLRELAATGTITYEDTLVCDEELRPDKPHLVAAERRRRRADACSAGSTAGTCPCCSRARWCGGPDRGTRGCGCAEDFDFVLRCLEHAPGGTGRGHRHPLPAPRRVGHAQRRAVPTPQSGVARHRRPEFFERHPELRGTRGASAGRAAACTAPRPGQRCTRTAPGRAAPGGCRSCGSRRARRRACTCGPPGVRSAQWCSHELEPRLAHGPPCGDAAR